MGRARSNSINRFEGRTNEKKGEGTSREREDAHTRRNIKRYVIVHIRKREKEIERRRKGGEGDASCNVRPDDTRARVYTFRNAALGAHNETHVVNRRRGEAYLHKYREKV